MHGGAAPGRQRAVRWGNDGRVMIQSVPDGAEEKPTDAQAQSGVGRGALRIRTHRTDVQRNRVQTLDIASLISCGAAAAKARKRPLRAFPTGEDEANATLVEQGRSNGEAAGWQKKKRGSKNRASSLLSSTAAIVAARAAACPGSSRSENVPQSSCGVKSHRNFIGCVARAVAFELCATCRRLHIHNCVLGCMDG